MRVANVIAAWIGAGCCRCPSDHFSIRAWPSLSTAAAPSVPNGLGAHAELLRQSGSCTSPNKTVQACNVCQAYLHIKVYRLSISFIARLWSPWGISKSNHCWGETGIVSASPATYSGQKPYENSLMSCLLFPLAFNYRWVGSSCFPFFICVLFLAEL